MKASVNGLLDLRIDLVFKMFFTRESNRDLLVDFLTAFIQPSSPISQVEILNPILENSTLSDKTSILDLRLKLDTGELIDVEMQILKQKNFRKRIVYYWSKLHQGQLSVGEDYNILKKTISIVILDFEEFKISEENHHIFEIRERRSHELLSDDLIIHFLELPKLEKTNNLGHIEKWGQFFYGIVNAEDKVMAKAQRALIELSDDEKAYHLAFDREKAMRDRLTYEADMENIKKELESESRKIQKKSHELENKSNELENKSNELENKSHELENKSNELEMKDCQLKKEAEELEIKNLKLFELLKTNYRLLVGLGKNDEEISAILNMEVHELSQFK